MFDNLNLKFKWEIRSGQRSKPELSAKAKL